MTEKEKPSFVPAPASAEATAGKKATEDKEKKELNIEDIKKQLEECQRLKDEYLAGWQRARADFLNYKKEEMERIGELLKYANEEFVLRILPVLDNFDLAEKKLPESLKGNDENIRGLLLVKKQILDLLKNWGIESMKTIGEKFDPNFHEIVGEVGPSEALAKEVESGIIVEEIQKGYKTNGRLLRPAKVKVSK